MNPTAFDLIRELINRVTAQIDTLNTLLGADLPQLLQRIVYTGARYYLQQLLVELEEIAWELALQEIQQFIGNEVFTGEDASSELYDLETMEDIRNELRNGCTPEDLECIVSKTATFPQINAAVKQRIIDDVIEIVGFAYTGRDADENALPVLVDEEEIPWDDPEVPASALFAGVPFAYNRQAAADKAEAMAEGTDDILTQFAGSGTDSGRFISLALHAGGFPMTVRPGQEDCETSLEDSLLPSWCATEPIPDLYEGNKVWLVHNSNDTTDSDSAPAGNLLADQRLVGYLLGNPDVLGEGIVYQNGGFYEVISVEEVIGTPSQLITEGSTTWTSFPSSHPLPFFSGPVYDVYGNAGLVGRIEQTMSVLSAFEIGDYIFTGGNDEHGFLIVARGPMMNCEEGTVLSTSEVFWVADLPGEQVGTPRPFYCSRLVDSGTEGWFAARYWYFIKVPDLVWVAFERLYKDDPF